MFRNILLPTDGSQLSEDAARRAVTLAKESGARITALYVKPDYPVFYSGEGIVVDSTPPGRFAELVDALGIFEYFNDTDAVIFLQRALRLVKPGGAVIVSNMLTSSPQIDFVLRGIGWEDIHPRSLQQLQDIHLAAGVPVENVTVVVPKDGVYAVMEIKA